MIKTSKSVSRLWNERYEKMNQQRCLICILDRLAEGIPIWEIVCEVAWHTLLCPKIPFRSGCHDLQASVSAQKQPGCLHNFNQVPNPETEFSMELHRFYLFAYGILSSTFLDLKIQERHFCWIVILKCTKSNHSSQHRSGAFFAMLDIRNLTVDA